MPYCFNRIHVGCFTCRDVAKDDANERTYGKRYVDRPCRDAGGHANEREQLTDKAS